MKAVQAMLAAVVLLVSGCDSGPPWTRPASAPPLAGIVDPSELKRSNETITGARTKKLALVLSKNVEYSRTLNDQMRKVYSGWTYQFNVPEVREDIDIVFSDEIMMSGLLAPIRDTFGEVYVVRDIPEGFERGAHYVGVLDLDVNTVGESGFFNATTHNTAKASLLFIDRQLTSGPLVEASVDTTERTLAKGASGNIRDGLRFVKEARTKMISDFSENFAAKVRR